MLPHGIPVGTRPATGPRPALALSALPPSSIVDGRGESQENAKRPLVRETGAEWTRASRAGAITAIILSVVWLLVFGVVFLGRIVGEA